MNSETLYLKTNIDKWDLEEKQYSMEHQKKRDLQSFATKLTEKILDPCNAKGYYNSYLKIKKSTHTKTLIKIFPKQVLAKFSITLFIVKQNKTENFLNEKKWKNNKTSTCI